MVQRVTNLSMSLRLQESLRSAQSRRFDASNQLSSGKLVSRYSDSPTDASAIVRMGAEQADWASYAKAADDATAWLNTQDTALQEASSILHRVRELAVAGASSIVSPTEREAIAAELETLRDRLIDTANTSYLGRSVFGGFADVAVEDVAGTWTFSGDAGEVQRRIAPEVVVKVNSDGAEIFGFNSGGDDLFTFMDRLAANVRANDVNAISSTDLVDLAANLNRVGEGLADLGGRANRVEGAKHTGALQQDGLRSNRSILEDADIAESVLQLSQAETAYEATLAATARAYSTSLLDFLR